MSKIAVVAYLLLWLVASGLVVAVHLLGFFPAWLESSVVAILSMVSGAVGGVLYCLRAVYVNACVRDAWSARWLPWYFIRPVTSALSGLVAWLFLSAGLLVLGAEATPADPAIGYFALSFIAGLNVDRFLEKIELIAESTWGIRVSRSVNSGKRQGGEDGEDSLP